MILLRQSHEILDITNEPTRLIERAARTCYKSEHLICEGSDLDLIKKLIKRGHEAMLEFANMTVEFVTDRAISNELTRHRICSFAQSSTRYIKYSDHVPFIIPEEYEAILAGIYGPFDEFFYQKFDYLSSDEHLYLWNYKQLEDIYTSALKMGYSAQRARDALPLSTATTLVASANFREWRHIFKLRCSKKAHPRMRALMIPLVKECQEKIPLIFDDIKVDCTT
jgi:thymidylate synthase (FAD)